MVKCGLLLEVVVKTWSRINSIDGSLFREDSGKNINFDSHFETPCAGRQDYAFPTGGQSKILALICSEITYAYNGHNYIFFAKKMNTILVSKFYARKVPGQTKVTKNLSGSRGLKNNDYL